MAQAGGEGSERSLKDYTKDNEIEILTVDKVLADLERDCINNQPVALPSEMKKAS